LSNRLNMDEISDKVFGGVMVLANRARELGATEEEINEVLRIPYYVAGSRPLITGNNAFPKKE
jgi:alkylhydroperoxidase/carboxymuconolactone decarboxylase family protein YurZ